MNNPLIMGLIGSIAVSSLLMMITLTSIQHELRKANFTLEMIFKYGVSVIVNSQKGDIKQNEAK